MKAWLALILVLCSIGVAFAEAPKTSIRPLARPVLAQPLDAAVPDQPFAALPALARMRPLHRPGAVTEVLPVAAPEKPRKGLRGLLTPRAKPVGKALASRKGSVCGVPSIKGKVLPRITSRTKGCGLAEPVSITSVDGVRLSEAATLDCPTAIALNTWVQKGLRPSVGTLDVTELQIAGHYTCRSRNNLRGAKISEHGKGRAIDISGVEFSNGKTLTVSRNFKALRKAHKSACGIFGTTLGPGSDGHHEDHMHFDTAPRRSGGAYCR